MDVTEMCTRACPVAKLFRPQPPDTAELMPGHLVRTLTADFWAASLTYSAHVPAFDHASPAAGHLVLASMADFWAVSLTYLAQLPAFNNASSAPLRMLSFLVYAP